MRLAYKIMVDGVPTRCRHCFDREPRVHAPPGATKSVACRVPLGKEELLREFAATLRRGVL